VNSGCTQRIEIFFPATGAPLPAELTGAALEGAELTAAALEGAELTAAALEGAELTAAALEDAELTAAALEGAELTAAALEDAELDGAELAGGATAALLARAALVETADELPAVVLLLLQPATPKAATSAIPATWMGNLMPMLLLLFSGWGRGHCDRQKAMRCKK